MIREFIMDDLNGLEPNAMSCPVDCMHVFEGDAWWRYTLENDGIKAIICFIEEKPGEWAVFTLISKRFTARDSAEIRKFIARAADVLKPKKIWTFSKPIAFVNKWHEFFGFVFEKKKKLKGKIYNKWVMDL